MQRSAAGAATRGPGGGGGQGAARTGTATCGRWRNWTISASARERELDNARKYAIERFAQELVPVGDALEAGINAGAANPGPGAARGRPGDLASSCSGPSTRRGIKIIDPVGSALRSGLARGHGGPGEPRSSRANTVLSVIQKGYSLNGRLLRPARVIVSKAPGGRPIEKCTGHPPRSGHSVRIFRGFSQWVK